MITPPYQDQNEDQNKKLKFPVWAKVLLVIEGGMGIVLVLAIWVTGINPLQVAERQWDQYMLEGQERAAFQYLCSKGRQDFCGEQSRNPGLLGLLR